MSKKNQAARGGTSEMRADLQSSASKGKGLSRPKPNNYFHVRVYTDSGARLELFRDRKQPSTLQEIIDGLKRAIEVLEQLKHPASDEPPPSTNAVDPHAQP